MLGPLALAGRFRCGPAPPRRRFGSRILWFAWRYEFGLVLEILRGALTAARAGETSFRWRVLLAMVRAALIDVHTVDNPDDHGVYRQVLCLGCEPGARPLDDEDEFPLASADGVDGHECPAGRD